MSTIRNYKDLEVWKKAFSLVLDVYKLTGQFPSEEKYGITSQIRRSAVSIPSNIAEGKLRGSDKEFKRFLLMAFASGGELETQLALAKELFSLPDKDKYVTIDNQLEEIMKMLNGLIKKLDASC